MKMWQKKFLFCDYSLETDRDILNRIALFNIFITIYIITAIPFGIINMIMKNYIITMMLFIGVAINIGTRAFLCITKKHIAAFTIATTTMALLLLLSYITGGINNYGPMWYFAFPVAVLILLGPLKGAIASIFLIIISLSFLLPPFSPIMKTTYSPEFLVLHLISYVVVLIFAFSYEFQKQKTKEEIKTLKGIISICASCKKIRDDKGYWNQLEAYICNHSEAKFSHSICHECSKKLYPDLYED